MNGHLVTIKVGVERCTSQRVQLNSLTFNQLRLESLNTQTVQRRGTVQQNRMSFHDIFQNIPNDRLLTIDNLFRRFDGLHNTTFDQFTNHKRLIEFGCHVLRQTAFVHLQFRTDHNDRTSGIVNTLTQQVLTETTLLTLQTVWQRLQRTIGVCLNGTRLTRVVEQRVNRLLKHTLLITQNDFRSLDINQSFQTIVTNDHTTIQIIQVRSGETSTIQRNQRTQFGRNHRNHLHDHPFRFITAAWSTERLYHLQAFQSLILALLRTVRIGSVTQFVGKRIQIQTGQQIVNSFGSDLGDKLIRICIFQQLILFRQTIQNLKILLFWEQIQFRYAFRTTSLNNHVALIIDDRIQFLGRKS